MDCLPRPGCLKDVALVFVSEEILVDFGGDFLCLFNQCHSKSSMLQIFNYSIYPSFFGTIKHTFSSGWERGKCVYGGLLNVIASIFTWIFSFSFWGEAGALLPGCSNSQTRIWEVNVGGIEQKISPKWLVTFYYYGHRHQPHRGSTVVRITVIIPIAKP